MQAHQQGRMGANGRDGPQHPQAGLRQQAMHQVIQWQHTQAWQAQQHQQHQMQAQQKTFDNFGQPAAQTRRAPSQAIPIREAPSSSEATKDAGPQKSSALAIVDPDTMEEVKVEKVQPKPKARGGKGGKGGPRLTGLANYEARKMQRQSSVGNKNVSSAFSGMNLNNNDHASPKNASATEAAPVLGGPGPISNVPAPSPPLQVPPPHESPAAVHAAYTNPHYNAPINQHMDAPSFMADPSIAGQPYPGVSSAAEYEQAHMARMQAQHQHMPPHQQQNYYMAGGYPNTIAAQQVQGYMNGSAAQQSVDPTNGADWQQHSDDTASQPDETPTLDDADEMKGRSKAQMKNQKKHQRQRERKAKELRNQCMQLVVKWKLSALAAPLISMGFAEEQCIDAVCACSDGKASVDIERCVAWLVNEQSKGSAFSFGNEEKKGSSPAPDIDITDEVQKMVDTESAMGISGAEVERAVLAHNGDVHSACLSLSESGSSGISQAGGTTTVVF